MAANYEKLGKPYANTEWAKGVALMNAQAQALKRQGLLPGRFPQESSEQLAEPIKHSDHDREALVAAGAKLILPESLSLQDQKKAGRPFWYIVDGGRKFISLQARPIEVAIFPTPEEFFVPGSFGKTKTRQEELLAADIKALRERFGLESVAGILPEVSEATQVIFEHSDGLSDREDRLLAQKYGFRYIRTNTPTDESGSHVAYVGHFHPDSGLYVDDWLAGHGYGILGAARWVVPAQAVVENR